jgi:dCTP deaminase
VDLSLDEEISVWEAPPEDGVEHVISPGSSGFNANAVVAAYTTLASCAGGGYVLDPNRFILAWTFEKIRLPFESRIGARIEGKSSLARIGLGIHVTAPTIHPGFGTNPTLPNYSGSPLRLEIWNAGVYPIRLIYKMPISQILFEEVHGTPEEGYSGQHAVQGPGGQPDSPTGGQGGQEKKSSKKKR